MRGIGRIGDVNRVDVTALLLRDALENTPAPSARHERRCPIFGLEGLGEPLGDVELQRGIRRLALLSRGLDQQTGVTLGGGGAAAWTGSASTGRPAIRRSFEQIAPRPFAISWDSPLATRIRASRLIVGWKHTAASGAAAALQSSGSIALVGVGRSVICWPNRLPISSTAVRAVRPRSSRNGLSSTISTDRTSPESCSISIIRCASR